MTSNALKKQTDSPEEFGDELSPGTTLFHGQYTIDRFLNSGGFGITYLARDSLGRKVVIKECFPGAMCCRAQNEVRLRSRSYQIEFGNVLELFEKEARALSMLQHPNIVGVHQIFHDNGTAYMALDFVEGQDLLQVREEDAESLDPYVLKHVLLSLLDALSYVHASGMLHRDISPDNILLDEDGSPVLIDFGAARENATRASRVLSRVHTVKDGYSPQEFYLVGTPQGPTSDLYALAATMHHLVTGEAPANSQARLAAVAEKQPDPYQPLAGRVKGFDHHFLEAIDQCLSVFPQDRLANANAWRDKIDDERRRNLLREQARQDKDIDKRVADLVAETARLMKDDLVKEEKGAKAKPKSEAKKQQRNRQDKPKDYWAVLMEPREASPERPEEPPIEIEVASVVGEAIVPEQADQEMAEARDLPAEPEGPVEHSQEAPGLWRLVSGAAQMLTRSRVNTPAEQNIEVSR